MTSLSDRLFQAADAAGWDESSQIDVLLGFISKMHSKYILIIDIEDEYRLYLATQVQRELLMGFDNNTEASE